VLSREETWAHATAVPEVGGLLLATPDAPKLVGEAYWQVGKGRVRSCMWAYH
jgi:hypothetical protein